MKKKDYLIFLKKLKDKKDFYLLKKTILNNKKVDIGENEISRLIEKLNLITSIRTEFEKRKYNLIKLDKNYSKTFEKFMEQIEYGEIQSNCTVDEIKNKLYDVLESTKEDDEEDQILLDDLLYDITIFKYVISEVLQTHTHFGENGNIQIDRKRTQFIRASIDSILLSLPNDLYQKNIHQELQKLKNKEISFLNDNFIFSNIKRGTFLNHYNKYFKIEEFPRNSNIFLEENLVDKIYFIKDGRVEINLQTNLFKLHQYTSDLIKINPDINTFFKDDVLVSNLINQPKNYIEDLKKKKNFLIFLLAENDMLGIEESYYDFRRLYRANVISDKAVVYSIPINKFKKIIDFEPKIFEDYKNYSQNKFCNLIKRLINIKNDCLKFIDENYSYEISKKDKNFDLNKSVNLNKLKEVDLINKKKQSGKNIDIQGDVYKYFRNYYNMNKEHYKKFDLILNPRSLEDYSHLFNKFLYEKTKIKLIKSNIERIKNDSIEKILPHIVNYKKVDFSSSMQNNQNSWNPYKTKLMMNNKNSFKISNNNSLNHKINVEYVNENKYNNNISYVSNIIRYEGGNQIETYKEKKYKNRNSSDSSIFMTNKHKDLTLYDPKNNSTNNSIIHQDICLLEERVSNYPEDIDNIGSNYDEDKELYFEKLLKEKMNKSQFFNRNIQNGPDDLKTTRFILEKSSDLKLNKLKRLKQKNIPRYNSRFGRVEISSQAGWIDEDSTLLKRDKSFSGFIPYKSDNSITAIRNLSKKIQMMVPKKNYEFKLNN